MRMSSEQCETTSTAMEMEEKAKGGPSRRASTASVMQERILEKKKNAGNEETRDEAPVLCARDARMCEASHAQSGSVTSSTSRPHASSVFARVMCGSTSTARFVLAPCTIA